VNDRIGKCRIIAKLGQGGMANVFLSVVPGHAGVYKLLVVKVLREELAEDADFLAMFLNEARLAARLNHPNVVTTYEIGVDGGQHYLAMDYLDGQPYSAVLRKTRGKIPLDIHLRVLADTLAGLDYAHTLADYDGTPLTVVHRDVSPQNVFIGYDGQVKVVDFGIAKAAGAASTTQSGVFKGKLAYVAPEQAAAQPVDARADIFSVGVMLWEAIAGRRLAQGESETTILGRRLAGIEPRIRDVVADVDPELADICDRAMAHHRDHRFPDARSMQDALERVLDRTARRVGRREVGAFVSELFADKREEIRAVIDEQMKRVLRDTSSALPLPVLGASRGVDPTPTHVEGFARRSSGTLAAANVSQGAPPAPAGHGRLVAASLVGLALTGILAIALVVTLRKPAPVADESALAARDRERVELRIEFAPEGATAKLDGVPLASSPFVAQVDRDGTIHRIDVEAPGMAPQTTMVSYDKDVAVSIVLVPEPASADAAAPAQASAATPPAPPRGDRPVARPADKKGSKQPGEIDEADPYRKK
jgi:serine/threonine-protein kinase